MIGKILKYGSIILTAFYIGNVAPVELPSPDKIKSYFTEAKKKVSRAGERIPDPEAGLEELNRLRDENNGLEERVRGLESQLKNILGSSDNRPRQYIPPTNIIPTPRNDQTYAEEHFQISPLEEYMIELVNEQRKLHNLPMLRYNNPRLFEAARQHSSEMMQLGYFSHESPVRMYGNLDDRLKIAGERSMGSGSANGWISCAENISFAPACEDEYDKRWVELSMFGGKFEGTEKSRGRIKILTSQFRQGNCILGEEGGGLMFSPGHRANILNPRFDYIGIGIVTGWGLHPDGKEGYGMWVTQVFAEY